MWCQQNVKRSLSDCCFECPTIELYETNWSKLMPIQQVQQTILVILLRLTLSQWGNLASESKWMVTVSPHFLARLDLLSNFLILSFITDLRIELIILLKPECLPPWEKLKFEFYFAVGPHPAELLFCAQGERSGREWTEKRSSYEWLCKRIWEG